MKGFYKVLMVLTIISIFSNATYAIDKETLWTRLSHSVSNAQYDETFRIAKQNLGLIEEIFFLSDFVKNNNAARVGCIQILRESCEEGLITQEHFFEIFLRLYNQLNTIALPEHIRGMQRMLTAQMGAFAHEPSFPVSQQFSGFTSLTAALFKAGLIKNQGILNSLNQKISNAQKSLEKKDSAAKTSAANQIQAAINELDAQKGKGISEDGYEALSRYCRHLITKIQNTP